MFGAIIGDIVGSRFEFKNIKSKKFTLFDVGCFPTDDSIMSLAVAKSILDCHDDYANLSKVAIKNMQIIGRNYPNCGYGSGFYAWIFTENPQPYYSFGNGAAMRVSACGHAARSLDEAKKLAKSVTEITHNHPEGLKGAEATTVAIYMALHGRSIAEIRNYIDKNYYPMNFTLAEIRYTYEFDATCQNTVPQAIMAFLESTSYEDAIRNAISIGGDSDTLAAITGSIAGAYFGIPYDFCKCALSYLDNRLYEIIRTFDNKYPSLIL